MLLRVALAVAAVAGARSGRVEQVEHSVSEMAFVEGGSFAMGFPGKDNEEEVSGLQLACTEQFGDSSRLYCKGEFLYENALPRRRVYVPTFEIDRFEVTVGRYRECAAAGGCDVSALVSGDTRYVEDAGVPMVSTTWQDAADYCAWVGKRLPSEAEWEKAARGNDGRRWPWGNHDRVDGANHGAVDIDVLHGPVWGAVHYVADGGDGHENAVAPGTLLWSDSEYGVYDLAGNVSEWVADYYTAGYDSEDIIDPRVSVPPEGTASLRVYRGGSWAEPKIFGRTYFRLFADPNQRAFDRGFRCARDAGRDE